jgi:hypothetical protein
VEDRVPTASKSELDETAFDAHTNKVAQSIGSDVAPSAIRRKMPAAQGVGVGHGDWSEPRRGQQVWRVEPGEQGGNRLRREQRPLLELQVYQVLPGRSPIDVARGLRMSWEPLICYQRWEAHLRELYTD